MEAQTRGTWRTIRFTAQLLRHEADGRDLLLLPEDMSAAPPSTMVEGTIDGFPFRTPLEGNSLRFSRALQTAAGLGDTVTVEITRIGDEPEVRVPADLLEALCACPTAQTLFEQITPMARREWVRWVASAKQIQTRQKRVETGIDMLTKGKRRPCCFPGINWVTKDLVPPEETWIAWPQSKSKS